MLVALHLIRLSADKNGGWHLLLHYVEVYFDNGDDFWNMQYIHVI